jgi:LETM1-like protein
VALKELQEFIEKAKLGRIGNDDITRFARLFKDELTLENTSRGQLVSLCKFMGVPPFGGDNFLRYQVSQTVLLTASDSYNLSCSICSAACTVLSGTTALLCRHVVLIAELLL